MAEKKTIKAKRPKAKKENPEAAASAPIEASTSAEMTKSVAKKSAKGKRRAKRTAAKKAKPKAKPTASKKPSKKPTQRAKRYTPAERSKILAAAKHDGLSGPAAAKKFGISQLTFYTWRRKAGAGKSRPGGRPKGSGAGGEDKIGRDITDTVRKEIQARVADLVPEIIRQEIERVLGSATLRGGRRD